MEEGEQGQVDESGALKFQSDLSAPQGGFSFANSQAGTSAGNDDAMAS